MRNLLILGLLVFGVGMAFQVTRVPAQSGSLHSHDSIARDGGEMVTAPRVNALTAFEKMKTLVGDWEAHDGTSYGGKPIRSSYKLVSGGTSLMETYYQVGPDFIDMVTIYHLDGDSLMLTHFCDVDNQVRMRADPATADLKALKFNYLDATNLSVSNKEVVHDLEITFQDADHFTQTWTWRVTDKGKTSMDKAVYNFVRRK